MQESRTKTTSLMVMLVSAMFVDKMTCVIEKKKSVYNKLIHQFLKLNNKTSTDLSHTVRDGLEHSPLLVPGDLRVKGQDSVLMTALEGHNIGGITISHSQEIRGYQSKYLEKRFHLSASRKSLNDRPKCGFISRCFCME